MLLFPLPPTKGNVFNKLVEPGVYFLNLDNVFTITLQLKQYSLYRINTTLQIPFYPTLFSNGRIIFIVVNVSFSWKIVKYQASVTFDIFQPK